MANSESMYSKLEVGAHVRIEQSASEGCAKEEHVAHSSKVSPSCCPATMSTPTLRWRATNFPNSLRKETSPSNIMMDTYFSNLGWVPFLAFLLLTVLPISVDKARSRACKVWQEQKSPCERRRLTMYAVTQNEAEDRTIKLTAILSMLLLLGTVSRVVCKLCEQFI
eukprot:2308047-Amphidinium_carterae.1